MLKVSGLQYKYNDKAPVLTGLTLDLQAPSLIGFLGPDGAGKSTLFKILATLLSPDQGVLEFMGMDIIKDRHSMRKRIGYMPERFSLYEDLSIEENLQFFGRLFGYDADQIAEKMKRLFVFSRLEEFKSRPAGQLSGGMKQKLALSCMLMHDPDLLILDEPTTGVDPTSRDEFWDLLQELRKEGRTILVSSPYIDEVSACDSLVILDHGKSLGHGSPSWWIDQVPCPVWQIGGDKMMDSLDILVAKTSAPIFLFGHHVHLFDVKGLGKNELEKLLGPSYKVQSVTTSLEDAVLWTLHQNQ